MQVKLCNLQIVGSINLVVTFHNLFTHLGTGDIARVLDRERYFVCRSVEPKSGRRAYAVRSRKTFRPVGLGPAVVIFPASNGSDREITVCKSRVTEAEAEFDARFDAS